MADARADNSRNHPASAPAEALRCRSLLADLLRPLAPTDADQAAADLIAEFRTLPATLSADRTALHRALGARHGLAVHLETIHAAMLHSLRTDLDLRVPLGDYTAITDFLRLRFGHSRREQVDVLFLDGGHNLLAVETLAAGTINSATIHPREIVRRALELGAIGLIVAHNHPSGNPEPSRDDLALTHRLHAAATAMDMRLHDHIVLTHGDATSFRQRRLL